VENSKNRATMIPLAIPAGLNPNRMFSMESSFERGFREKQTEYVSVALVEERISGESTQRCHDDPGRLELHNDLEKDLVRPLDGDNDQIILSAFMDNDDLLDNDINGKNENMKKHILRTLKEIRSYNKQNVFELINGDIDKGD
jgi:hypothetical protein